MIGNYLLIFILGLIMGTAVFWLWSTKPFVGQPFIRQLLVRQNARRCEDNAQTIEPVKSEPVKSEPVKSAQVNSQVEALQLQQLRLLQMAQFNAGFLARTSHELRSPLSSLMSLHQLILNDLCDSPEEERACVQNAYNAARRLLEMLETVIDLSKLEIGSRPLQIQSVSLHRLLEDFQTLVHLQVANRNIRLKVDLPDMDIYVNADPYCFKQALLCLFEPLFHDRSVTQARLFVVVNTVDSRKQASEQAFDYAPDRANAPTALKPSLRWVHICLEDDRPSQAWQESIDVFSSLNVSLETVSARIPLDSQNSPDYYFSESLILQIAQIFLQVMQGKIELIELDHVNDSVSQNSSDAKQFCLRCSLPLAGN